MTTENLPRRVELKWLFVAIAIVALIGFVLWWWQASECSRIAQQRDKDIRASAEQSAETVARSIAAFGNSQIVAGNWDALQRYADDLVKTESVDYVAITDLKDIAVVHTNRSFRGSKLGQAVEAENMTHATVPVMNLSRQVASVRVAINYNLQ